MPSGSPPPSIPPWIKHVLNRYKTDRMWNINANIVMADLLSTSATAVVIGGIYAKLPTAFAIVAVTAIIDGAISLAAFALLHIWLNRERGVRDLARLQVHRWFLSPLHYLVGSGIQFGLLAAGVSPSVGVLIAYGSTLAVVRTVHTFYGKKSGLFQ